MENGETLDEPFRKTLHGVIEDNKWKKIAYIFFVIAILAGAGSAIFIFLYFSKGKEKEYDNSDDDSQRKWELKGDRIKTN